MLRYFLSSLFMVMPFPIAWLSAQENAQLSHPPLRTAPKPVKRTLATGPARYVATTGDDEGDGSPKRPWKSIAHALRQVQPGETLYLREGIYYEPINLKRAGRKDAPIVLRAYPGERVVVDAGLHEFFDDPQRAWETVPKSTVGEYRSTQTYPNLRDVMGRFGDSMIGLHTYHHRQDLIATNELVDWKNWDDTQNSDLKPLYCGPGLWYDRSTGRIHIRLAHTRLPILGENNYRGPTDPRTLPMVVAPFRATPLTIDRGEHVRIQDLILRGAGYDAVDLRQSRDVWFDNVTIWCGSYGLRAMGVHGLSLKRCGFYGSVPPWCFRGDTSLRSYPGRPHRDITRFGTHAVLVPETGREFSVFAYPINDEWEIAYCNFHDAHDGPYLGGINLRFHHNEISDMQDDGIYLSPMARRYGKEGADLHLYQNYLHGCLTPLAFGGPEQINTDRVWLYRNLVDLREPVLTGRPNTRRPEGGTSFGKVMGDHGSPPWTQMLIYHNTFVMAGPARFADMGTLNGLKPERPRHLFNNVFLHFARLPGLRVPSPETGQADANLYWHPDIDAARKASFFKRYRGSPGYAMSKSVYAPGFTTNSLVVDPAFERAMVKGANTYRPRKSSPVVDAGVTLPKDWPDPLRTEDKGKPDLGALPMSRPMFAVGRMGKE